MVRSPLYVGQALVYGSKATLPEAKESDGIGSQLVRFLQHLLFRIQIRQFVCEEIVSQILICVNSLVSRIDIKVPMIKELLEKSCHMYVTQFSRLILGELQYHQRLHLRIKELEVSIMYTI